MKLYIRCAQSITILNADSDEYYCNVELNGNRYTVSVCPKYSDGTCGYPIRERVYPTESAAIKAYKRYVKEFNLSEDKNSYYYTKTF